MNQGELLTKGEGEERNRGGSEEGKGKEVGGKRGVSSEMGEKPILPALTSKTQGNKYTNSQ